MMKLIVTHFSPDLDALTSCWLIRRFLPGWEKAEIKFVAAGSTFNNQPPDLDKNVIHVDTGMGKFDHHQTSSYTCAAKKVFLFLKNEGYISKNNIIPLTRIIEIVNQIDHFKEVNFIDPTADIYDFCLHQMIEGAKTILESDDKLIDHFLICLDAVLQTFKNKIKAEEEIKNGLIFSSKWGKCLAIQSKNEETTKLALKIGYVLVVRKDLTRGFVRIKAHPEKNIDLTDLYKKIKYLDKKGDWFFHISKTMILNGSSKNPSLTPTNLTLTKIIEIIKNL